MKMSVSQRYAGPAITRAVSVWGLLILLILLLIVFSLLKPDTFPTYFNIRSILNNKSVQALLALAVFIPMTANHFDLSAGFNLGISQVLAIGLQGQGLPWQAAVLAVLLMGALVGLINGILVTRIKIDSFIATLGTLYVARGAALLLSDGATFPNLEGNPAFGTTGYAFIGAGDILNLPVSIWILIVVALGAAYVASSTPLGRHIFAVGGNERAAALSGIRVNRVKLFVYMFSGFCAAIVGLIVSSELMAAHPATGTTFELNAIAAAVLGGTSMSGGRGTIGGTIIGAFVIGILSDGLVMMGVSEFWQMVIKGVVIIAAVVVDQAQRKLQQRVALQQMAQLA